MKSNSALQTPGLSRTWGRRLGLALVTVLGLWVIGWLMLPGLIQSQLESKLSAWLGRTVTVGEVDFKPWSLELSLREVALATAEGTDTQVKFSRLYIDAELQSLLRWAPVVDAVQLEGLRVNLTHLGDGHFDVDDLMARLNAPPPQTTKAQPPRFALYNLVLSDAALTVNDIAHQQVHRLQNLQVSVPFLSNLDSQRDVQVQPRLAFDFNGSHVESSASGTPFATHRKTEARLSIKKLDLAPYLSYQPAALPVRLAAGVLEADLNLVFEQTEQPLVRLDGQVSASAVQLIRPGANPSGGQVQRATWLTFEQLNVQLKDVQPLRRQVGLGQVTLVAPHLRVLRDRAGGIDLLTWRVPQTVAATQTEHPSDTDGDAGWQLQLDAFDLQAGRVEWQDAQTRPAAHLQLDALTLQAKGVRWPMAQPAALEGSAELKPGQVDQGEQGHKAKPDTPTASLHVQGQVSDQQAEVSLRVAGVPLRWASPYLAQWISPQLDASLSATTAVHWAAAKPGQVAKTEVAVNDLTLDRVRLSQGPAEALASIAQLRLRESSVDLMHQTVALGQLQVDRPALALSRAADGRWMFEDWQVTASPTPQAAPAQSVPSQSGWALTLNEAQINGGTLHWDDQSVTPPVTLEVSRLAVKASHLSAPAKRPFDLALSLRVGQAHDHANPGTLAWRGKVSLQPLAVEGTVQAQQLPLHAVAPYAAQWLNADALRADASFKGHLDLSLPTDGLHLDVAGDARLDDVQVQTQAQSEPLAAAEDLLTWKSLVVDSVHLALAPQHPLQLDVTGTVLSDFYARVIVSPTGHLNLQDVLKPTAGSTQAELPVPSASVVAVTEVAQIPSQTEPATVSPAPAQIRFGPVSLLGGRVNFTDRFIQPNYAADLTELVGKLSAFSSVPVQGQVQMANLELRGRAQGTASLEVLGQINPLVQPVVLDLKGQVRNLELAPLSTYSARYAGYGIERGKLSMDVSYRVQPDGQLSANNKLVLNQLTFGDQEPHAVKTLPVKLAVALLADRQGVIDLDLPISGSLNDPQFRLMPLVFKIIGNLIVKAITAPFSLLASAFGGGDMADSVAFEPGSAALTESAKTRLDKVAQALQDRPALTMTVVGHANLMAEREAYQQLGLKALVWAEKRRLLAGKTPDAVVPAVTAEEYPALLKAAYKRADFPKPRNLIGLLKDIPPADMEKLLLSHVPVDEAAMQALALQRGVAVRDHLAALQVPMARLFLGAAKAQAASESAPGAWQPNAQLQLATP